VDRAAPEENTLRFIAQADLQVLGPIWTTAYITRNHGYMVFDTLFAIDSEFTPHPQMVRDYNDSPDKLTYRFKLRDGLSFHDGSPVRGVDCVASIRRWASRDALGPSGKCRVSSVNAGRITVTLSYVSPNCDQGFHGTLIIYTPTTSLEVPIGRVTWIAKKNWPLPAAPMRSKSSWVGCNNSRVASAFTAVERERYLRPNLG
jgi:ABC-type transport system substrate-binding protein